MKILFVINALWIGGVEKALINLVNSLDPKKYDITILSIMKDYSIRHLLKPHIKVKGIFPKKMKGIDHLFKYIPANILYKIFIREKYDIEVAYSDGKPVVLLGLNTISRAEKFTWIHQDISRYERVINCYKSWSEYIESYKNFNNIFCVSRAANDSFKQVTGIDKSTVLYNIIPSHELLEKAKEELKVEKGNRLVFTTVGRLAKEKGIMRLLHIHKSLLDSGFEYSLWIIGDGPEKEEVQKFIIDNHLQDTVTLYGFQENPYKYIAASDLYICPSYTEALSTTCIESLLLDVPILSTSVPGAEDILGDTKCGSIVENTTNAIYEELKRILSNPKELIMFRQDIERAKSKFNEKDILRNLENYWASEEFEYVGN
ncbi:glycosyltransferase [Caldibacillus lycopersici]|uniref:Glycosyltransferase n=1 Tax=Perspicuibacillus lycopersici TaxID=1325689 RepID=A0AAE3LLG7_9BACI|nr:glycosyltransferase [Perspicuibacillus lycopersici]MCU9612325.1 glycosyltransferase [Perspicuibacillus lycopersici]